MITTVNVMLVPNNKQSTRMFAAAGAARFAYNWALAREEEQCGEEQRFIRDYELRRAFTQLKATEEYQWLYRYSNNVTKQAIIDACRAYRRFFDGVCGHPRFKSRKQTRPSFYTDPGKIKITSTHVKLEKLTDSRKQNRQRLNWVRLAERDRIPADAKCLNPRVYYDGLNWWLSVGLEVPEERKNENYTEGIGIDIGIHKLAVCSDGSVYDNINKSDRVRKLKKSQYRLQRRMQRQYLAKQKGECCCKTKNILKTEKRLRQYKRKLSNIRQNRMHQVTSEIANRKPRFIVMEDLDVKDMLKDKNLSGAVWEGQFFGFYKKLEYKARRRGIMFLAADRYFPSSKICCVCGTIKRELSLEDRTYECECGNKIDRDYQAAINLREYGKRILPIR